VLLAGGLLAILLLVRREPPNVLFILVDTLRADRLDDYGRRRGLTPFLDGLAARSLVFERAYAPSSWTIPSIVSLFIGQHPFEHGVVDFNVALPPDQTTLAEVLAAHGYETAALLASRLMAVAPSLGQGFAEYRFVARLLGPSEEIVDATEVNAAAREWLARRTGRAPFFLYLHYMEPHVPYRAHEGITAVASKTDTPDERIGWHAVAGNSAHDPAVRARIWGFSGAERARLRDLYDGEVKYLDGRLAELFADLERQGALRNTIVVITSDHGEELGEHAIFGHGNALYESQIHVPLIVHVPGRPPGHVARPVETAGIAAALLGAAGIRPPRSFPVAPVPLAAEASAAEPPPPVIQLAKIGLYAVWLHRTAVVEGDRKLVVGSNGWPVVHDLRMDRRELRPRPPSAAEAARAAALDRFEAFAARRVAPPGMDEETLARLRALGYVGGP
jgi:arylsulfatase A-like enzyme